MLGAWIGLSQSPLVTPVGLSHVGVDSNAPCGQRHPVDFDDGGDAGAGGVGADNNEIAILSKLPAPSVSLESGCHDRSVCP